MTLAHRVNTALQRLGIEVRRRREPWANAGFPHSTVHPNATYSPWRGDEAFAAAYETVSEFTLVDVYRCHELWQLVAETAAIPGDGDLLEVGVWRGGTGALIAKRAQELGLDATVHLCDTFSGVVKASDRDTRYSGGEHADTSAGLVEELARRMGLANIEIHTGIFPEETGAALESKSFRLCHIDVDVYESARDILEWVWPRLRPGGLVVFDDYGFDGCEGVTRLVEEQRGAADRLTIHNLNGHAVVVKRA